MPRFTHGRQTRVMLGGVDISEYVTDVAVATDPLDVTSVTSAFRTAIPTYQHTISLGARNLRGLINALHRRVAEEQAEEFSDVFFGNTQGYRGMRADLEIIDETFEHPSSPLAEAVQNSLDRAWRERDERRARLQPGDFISDADRVCAPLPEHVIDQDTIDQGLTFNPRPNPRDEGYVTWGGATDAHTWSAKHAFEQNIPDLPAKLCEHCGMWPDHHDHHVANWSGEKCVCQQCDPEGDLHNPTSMYNE